MPEQASLEYQAEQQQMTGLMLALSDRTLLVPNTAVAELVAWQPADDLPGGVQRDGLVGRIGWRGLQLPLLSFEVLAGGTEPDVTESTRIAIFNSLEASAGAGFYAVLLQGIPRSIQVDNRLQPDNQAALRNGELAAVQLGGQSMFIPDLEGLEQGLRMARLQQRF
ncbi:chemotaxis protein CheW [Thiopseudomonas denitrificans]|uniref:Chemosensory pili system protein ChpC n=1 Tax=Thiopseudomonas denitrificans TaxID=1501432 RepID=A0A4R6TZ21_9GAMM|nr:chemotaxis protein CheW [Thiopseudomonas denitrificans]TDQ38122.1 chemosensory pili system protein ChpC [Thiopseudomonas denitrificans]